MLNTVFFKPRNLVVIGLIAVLAAFVSSSVKSAIDGGSAN